MQIEEAIVRGHVLTGDESIPERFQSDCIHARADFAFGWLKRSNRDAAVYFVGKEAMGERDGAGGQNRTGYARLFRAALYH